MTKGVHPRIRGRAVQCALGTDMDRIVRGLRDKTVNVDRLPLTLVGSDETRPYYLMDAFDGKRWEDPERFFYDTLFDTVGRALNDAGLARSELASAALFFGSTSMDIPIYEGLYEASADGHHDFFTQTASGFGVIAARVARKFGMGGPCYTFTTACTSSANGLLYAAAMMSLNDIRRALVIGYDVFNKLGYYGFESLKLLSPAVYRPFDRDRDGIIMGEACGAAVLDHASDKDPGFSILGGANICDTHNVALHNMDGRVVARNMRDALNNAGLKPSDVAAVKAHATGSYQNDVTESSAIRAVFGDAPPPVTGLKPYVGHTVGACGVVELILFTEALKAGFLPAVPGFETPDPELGVQPLTERMPAPDGVFMLNYFGFGGNCATLMIGNRG